MNIESSNSIAFAESTTEICEEKKPALNETKQSSLDKSMDAAPTSNMTTTVVSDADDIKSERSAESEQSSRTILLNRFNSE